NLPSTLASPGIADGDCLVVIYLPMQNEEESTFKQNIAAAMAHCALPVLAPPGEEEGDDCEIDICLSSEFFWPVLF
ncbi:MAG: hypothetical protein J4N72_09585, partial [Chloroflexi bacterium]|nr:hypothetical protein [Chloroflexota bacterium]